MKLTKTQNDIAKRFFLDFKTGSEVSREKYDSKRKKNVGIVSSLLAKFKKNNWIDIQDKLIQKINKKGKKYPQKIPHFRLNLNYFFDYAKSILKIPSKEKYEELKKILKQNKILSKEKKWIKEVENYKEFNKIEKEIIEYIFSFKKNRKVVCEMEGDLRENVLTFLVKIFLLRDVDEIRDPSGSLGVDYIKGFLVQNKKYLKKEISPKKQFENFWRTELKISENLINKLKLISHLHNNLQSLGDINEISKYSYMPTVIPHYESKKVKLELMRRWKIVFYKNKSPSPEFD